MGTDNTQQTTQQNQQPGGGSSGGTNTQQAPGTQSPGGSNGADQQNEEKASRSKLQEGLEHHKSRADAAEAELSKLKAEKAKAETERAEKQGEFEKLYRTEAEKSSGLAQKLERTLKETALLMEASKLDIIDPSDIGLVDLGKLKIENDKVTNAADVMAKFKESKPHLFGKKSTSLKTPTPTPGGGATSSNGKITSADVHAMTPEQRKEFLAATRAAKS